MGLAPSEFWNLSIPEVTQQLKGAAARRLFWRELGLWVAWHAAAFQRGKDLPALGPMIAALRNGGSTPPPTAKERVEQQRKQIMALSQAYGLPIYVNGRAITPPKKKPRPKPKKRATRR